MASTVIPRQGIVDEGSGGGDVKQKLKRRPLLVLFYMNGCSHCEANKPVWDEMKRKYMHIPVEEIESANVPYDEHVSGFQTMKYKPAKGRERVLTGQQASADSMARKLGLNRRLSTRRRSRRLSRHVSRRRIRH
jgi:hypothetical protein